ncbi:MAG TPA: diacylglycerol kinase family protein, partial [Limnochordia bacterium]
MRILCIVNPAAGGGRAARRWPALAAGLAQRGLRVETAVTRAAGEARRIAGRARDGGYRAVVAVGGDGTLHEVINGLLGGGQRPNALAPLPPIGWIPLGTGNDFAHAVGLGGSQRAILDAIAAGNWRSIDLGVV